MDFHRDNKQHLLPPLLLHLRELNCDVVSLKRFQNDVHVLFYGTAQLTSPSTWSTTKNCLVLDHVLWLCFTAVQNNWSLKKTWKAWLENMAQLNSAAFGTGVDEATRHGIDKPWGKSNRQHQALVATPRDSSLSCLLAVSGARAPSQ